MVKNRRIQKGRGCTFLIVVVLATQPLVCCQKEIQNMANMAPGSIPGIACFGLAKRVEAFQFCQ